MIETTVDNQNDLTIHKCSGNLTEQEILDTIHSFYESSLTKYTLWDYSNASMNNIPTKYVRKIFMLVKNRGFARQGGKTAIVTPKDLEYGFARMFQIMSDVNDFSFEIKVFRYVGEAYQWLFS